MASILKGRAVFMHACVNLKNCATLLNQLFVLVWTDTRARYPCVKMKSCALVNSSEVIKVFSVLAYQTLLLTIFGLFRAFWSKWCDAQMNHRSITWLCLCIPATEQTIVGHQLICVDKKFMVWHFRNENGSSALSMSLSVTAIKKGEVLARSENQILHARSLTRSALFHFRHQMA